MPELPEVETIKRDLCDVIVGLKIVDVDFLWPGIVKGIDPDAFRETIKNNKIIDVQRRAKNLFVELEGGWYLLFHMKMTGHLIYTDDCWKVDDSGKWVHHQGKDSPL